MSKIKPEITQFADKVAAALTINKDGIGEIKGDPYHDNMPEDLTPEIATKVRDYNTTFIAGTGLAFGNAAIAAMASNKKLDSLEMKFPAGGKDSVVHSITRESQSRNPSTGDTITKHGRMTTTHEVHGSSQKVGQLSAIRAQIGDLAVEKLAKG